MDVIDIAQLFHEKELSQLGRATSKEMMMIQYRKRSSIISPSAQQKQRSKKWSNALNFYKIESNKRVI